MKPFGKVWLVGAGPGDPELLTVKATRVIAQGDVIFIDDLVNRAVLEYAQPTTRIVAVGKRGGCRSTPQAMIERLMLREARAGLAVVRLKGGDQSRDHAARKRGDHHPTGAAEQRSGARD